MYEDGMLERQVQTMNRALAEASVYDITVPLRVGDHITTAATLILGGFTEYGLDDVRDYWHGNFAAIGLLDGMRDA